MKIFYSRTFLIPALIFIVNTTNAKTIIGRVKDKQTGEPVGFGSVRFLHTTGGTTIGANGSFNLEIQQNGNPSLIVISALGYQNDTLDIHDLETNPEILLTPVAGTLNDVVVTGTSKAMHIKENPVTVLNVSSKAIEQTIEANALDAIAKNAPGLQTVKTGPNVSKPFINGLGYNRVLTLYDGVLRVEAQQWGDEHGLPMDDYTVDRAEVIEGPSSLMYGSDAIAGVVSLFIQQPKDTDRMIHGRFLSEYQTNNGLIGNSLILNYGSGHWSYALRGSERIAKNYSNSVDGRVYNTSFKMANASAFIGYKNKNGYSNLNLTYYDNKQGIPDGSRDSLTRKFTYQVYEADGENEKLPQVDTITNRPVVSKSMLNSYKLSPLSQRIQDYRIYTDNQYKIGGGTVKATFGLEQDIRREFDHPTEVEQAGEYIVLNTWDYAARYNAPTIFNIEPSIGVSGMYQTNTSKDATDFPIPDYHLFDIGSYFYGIWKYKKWTVAGGIRYDHRSQTGSDMYTNVNPSTGFYEQVHGKDTVGADKAFSAFHLSFQGVTGSIGGTYRISEALSVKANIARGYRAPNITEIASNGLDPGAHIYYIGNLGFKPEFNLQEDISVIGAYNDFSFNLDLYNNYIHNYIYEDLKVDENNNPVIIVPGNRTFQYQQTNAQLYGLNATFNLHPQCWSGFQFDNTFSLVYGYNKNPKYKNAATQGEYLPFIPPPRWLSSIGYDIKTKNNTLQAVTLKAEADYNMAQNRYLGLYGAETATQAYTLVNLSASAELHYSRTKAIDLQFAVENLMNTAYQNHLSRLKYFEYYSQSPNGRSGIYNMGRNFCFKVIVPF